MVRKIDTFFNKTTFFHLWKILINKHDRVIHHRDGLFLILSSYNFLKYFHSPSWSTASTLTSPINICVSFWSKILKTLSRKIDMVTAVVMESEKTVTLWEWEQTYRHIFDDLSQTHYVSCILQYFFCVFI